MKSGRVLAVLNVEILYSNVLIAVGYNTYKSLLKGVKNADFSSLDIESLEKGLIPEEYNELVNACFEYSYKNKEYRIIKIQTYDEDVLLHEIVHYKQFIFEKAKIQNEPEFEAYFIEYVFRTAKKLLGK